MDLDSLLADLDVTAAQSVPPPVLLLLLPSLNQLLLPLQLLLMHLTILTAL